MASTPAFIKDGLAKIDKYLEEENQLTKALELIEKKTNVKKRYLALMILVWVGGYLICGYAASLLCSFVGFIYPAYKSVKAIESTATGDDTAWLMYWVVYASFSCLEFFSDILLSWVPLYFFLKCIFLLWCMAPFSYNGSKVIYNKLIRPWVLKNEDKIDEVFGYVSNNAEKLAGKVGAQQSQTVSDVVSSNIKNILDCVQTANDAGETKKSE